LVEDFLAAAEDLAGALPAAFVAGDLLAVALAGLLFVAALLAGAALAVFTGVEAFFAPPFGSFLAPET